MNTHRALRLGLLILLLFSLLQFNMACTSKEDKKAEHLKRAWNYLKQDKLKEALIEFKNVAQLDPSHDQAHYEMGKIYLSLKQPREAFQAFTRATSANPENLEAQLEVGRIFLLSKKFKEAKEKAELALQKAPENVEALLLLAGALFQDKQIDSAIETLKKAVSLYPDHLYAHLILARFYTIKGAFSEAEKAYLKTISLTPPSPAPYIELSNLYFRKGEYQKAEALLKKMVGSSDDKSQSMYFLARFYESQKNWEQAEKTYMDAAEAAQQGDATALMNLGSYYARRKSYEKASKAMENALKKKKDDLDIIATIAQLHLDFNHLDRAEIEVDRVLAKDQGHVSANLIKARISLRKKEYDDALERLNLVVREDPQNAKAYYFRSLALIKKEKQRQAEQDLGKALELNPGLLDARLILAEYYLRMKNTGLAREQMDAAERLAPKDFRFLMLRGQMGLMDLDFNNAEKYFETLVKLYPAYAPGYERLGKVYMLRKEKSKALTQYKKAIETNPHQLSALKATVGIYLEEKKYKEAIALCKKHERKVTGNKRSMGLIKSLLGGVHMAENDLKAARKYFEEATKIDPDLITPYLSLSKIYSKEGRFDEVLLQYEEILKKNPQFLPAYMVLGTSHQNKGDMEKAEIYYRKALEVKSDFAPAANNLAWILAEKGEKINEALDLARSAKEKSPSNASIVDTLGWIYYLKGSYLNARSEFEDCLELDPENPLYHYHLGRVYYKMKEYEKARQLMRKALELDPDFQEAEDARNLVGG